jgi:hypothetical protein
MVSVVVPKTVHSVDQLRTEKMRKLTLEVFHQAVAAYKKVVDPTSYVGTAIVNQCKGWGVQPPIKRPIADQKKGHTIRKPFKSYGSNVLLEEYARNLKTTVDDFFHPVDGRFSGWFGAKQLENLADLLVGFSMSYDLNLTIGDFEEILEKTLNDVASNSTN